MLTSEKISKYHFLTYLLNSFKADFVNLNQGLRDRYSNYYVDTMPLLLAEDDISFTLYNINFDNIAKLVEGTLETVLGVTVKVNLAYETRFKGLQAGDNIEKLVIITDDLAFLGNIQDNLEKYFLTFIDNFFKRLDYKFIYTGEEHYNKINSFSLIWQLILKELEKEEIKFYDNARTSIPFNPSDSLFSINKTTFYKSRSVL